jgi:hypothetical protein
VHNRRFLDAAPMPEAILQVLAMDNTKKERKLLI